MPGDKKVVRGFVYTAPIGDRWSDSATDMSKSPATSFGALTPQKWRTP